MSKLRIQVNLNIEYESAGDRSQEDVAREVTKNLEDVLGTDLMRNADDIYFTGWSPQIRVIDPTREQALCVADRKTPNYTIVAMFSSDGPAVALSVREEDLPELVYNVNAALREAHQMYLAHVRGN